MIKKNKLGTLKDINLSNKRGFQEDYAEYRLRLKKNYYTIKYYHLISCFHSIWKRFYF